MNRAAVSGAIANKPGSAGEAWVRLSWVRGLDRLGVDVRFVEQLGGEEPDPSAVAWFRDVISRFDLQERATLVHGGEALVGPAIEEVEAFAAEAVLVNISGHLTGRLRDSFRRRVLVDIDPGFTQIWYDAGLDGANVAGHDLHFTIGELIGTPDCPIPTGGIEWLKVRPPVVLEDWPAAGLESGRNLFTTVATWRGAFGRVEHEGRSYGLKVHEFRKIVELPRLATPARFEIALDIHPDDDADLALLKSNGWEIVDPGEASGTPDAFGDYVRRSGAEFSVAQGIYVETGSGWFSDRTTRYLASGRPALVQDTGFSRVLPVGEGLVGFADLEGAVAGAADIRARYPEHARTAREIAERYFDSDIVLSDFCARAGIG